jgi:hypothetical protein
MLEAAMDNTGRIPKRRPLLAGMAFILLLLASAWAAGAVYCCGVWGRAGGPLACMLALIFAAVIFGVSPWRRKLGVFLAFFIPVLAWFLSLTPKEQADWQPDVAKMPWVALQGDLAVFHNIRNFDYISESEYKVNYYDQAYNLSKLRGVDLFLSYWGSPHIAHTILSFAFEGDRYLAVSVETRKQRGQTYSAIRGFFRAYELIYILGDERDLIRLRTNIRKEDVYLYRLAIPLENARFLLMNYINAVNRLAERPEFYNALIDNCTTNIMVNTRAYALGMMPSSWKLFATGHVDEFVYERGALNRDLSFSELKRLSYINPAAQTADRAEDFSVRIREGLPIQRFSDLIDCIRLRATARPGRISICLRRAIV